jgi:oligoribonuclease (3'-5' exoribonuclease)
MSATRVLDFHDGPLVWVDCEMTGLNPRKDKILEIAVRLYNPSLTTQTLILPERLSSPMEISTLLMAASSM